MNRRDFITLLGGAAAAWPMAARAQRPENMRRIGVLSLFAEKEQITQAEITALREELARLGWIEDRNLRIVLRFGNGDSDQVHAYAAELAGLSPEAIVTDSGDVTRVLQQQTRSIPI